LLLFNRRSGAIVTNEPDKSKAKKGKTNNVPKFMAIDPFDGAFKKQINE
jgi:hypothetical protein